MTTELCPKVLSIIQEKYDKQRFDKRQLAKAIDHIAESTERNHTDTVDGLLDHIHYSVKREEYYFNVSRKQKKYSSQIKTFLLEKNSDSGQSQQVQKVTKSFISYDAFPTDSLCKTFDLDSDGEVELKVKVEVTAKKTVKKDKKEKVKKPKSPIKVQPPPQPEYDSDSDSSLEVSQFNPFVTQKVDKKKQLEQVKSKVQELDNDEDSDTDSDSSLEVSQFNPFVTQKVDKKNKSKAKKAKVVDDDCSSEESLTSLMTSFQEGLMGGPASTYQMPKDDEEEHYEREKKTSVEFGPYGSQWIHEEQVDDEYDDVLQKRSEQYDFLRNIKLPEQRSPEWFAMREGKITASDTGTVLGVCKYEPPYKFILKKTCPSGTKYNMFQSNIYCYHGKKYEEIATMIYKYRMNVVVEEFGLLGHPTYDFIGASPDGICNQYKLDGKHKSKFVGRMLEIKCPARRKILTEGDVYGVQVPKYYYWQVLQQLESCDLEECDFWQCKIDEYPSWNAFLRDTDEKEPFRSKSFGFEKGAIVQIIPKSETITKDADYGKYMQMIYDKAQFLYPTEIEMTPAETKKWIDETVAQVEKGHPDFPDYKMESVRYWRLEFSHNITIMRDRELFTSKLPTLRKMWNYVLYLRKHKDSLDLLINYVESRSVKYNHHIMRVIDEICNPDDPDYENNIQAIKDDIAKKVKIKVNT